MIMEQPFCQSCGMPMTASEHFGTNKDGSANNDYCGYCFKDGDFTQEMTMDEMILHCAEFVDEFNKDSETKLAKEEAIRQMKKFFPKMKRWSQS
jgi:hypothetical protein